MPKSLVDSPPQIKKTREIALWETRAELARVDKWAFLKYFVCTKDEHDETTLAKPFPQKAYLRVATRIIQEVPVFYLEKSRQLLISWIFAACTLHEAMFKKSRRIADQSEQQDKADALIERQRHIYIHVEKLASLFQPSGEFPFAKMTGARVGTDSKLEFPLTGSEIVAVPQGADVLRSFTWSWVFSDEINHQPKTEEGYSAAMPSVSGGGRWQGVGTPNGKTWGYYVREGLDFHTGKRLGRDIIDSNKVVNKLLEPPVELSDEEKRYWIERQLLEMPQTDFDAIPLEQLVACCPGMRYWENENGIPCIRIHYSADPAKDPVTEAGKQWYATNRKKYTQPKWEREYEIRYDTFEGRPVISNWQTQVFVKKPEYDSNSLLYLSYDFGTTLCGCFIAQFKRIEGFSSDRLSIIDEIILRNSNTPELAKETIRLLESKYRRTWENNYVRAFADPAGLIGDATSADKSLNTSIKILNAVGIFPHTKKFGVPESTEVLETVFAMVLPDNRPAIEIHEKCVYAIACFGGGLHYPTDGRPGYYEKDGEYDHGGDMARYLICNLFDYEALAPKSRAMVEHRTFVPVRRKYTGAIRGYRRIRRSDGRQMRNGVRFRP
jgi:hypothetical protein